MATYSAFFSSGLLASHHPFYTNATNPTPSPKEGAGAFSSYFDVSSIPDDSDIEDFEHDVGMMMRDTTPTPETQQCSNGGGQNTPKPATTRPRLRKRRSSVTLASSPISAIRSPVRNAASASHLQRHLSSGLRSRSGSVGVDLYGVFGRAGLGVATEDSSLVGRMRSGSLGTVAGATVARPNPRRVPRRIYSVPAPAPPPTAPLPAVPVPTVAPLSPILGKHNGLRTAFPFPPTVGMKQQQRTYGVPPAGGAIDEDMKEN